MIYIVEDDRSIRDLECYALSHAGYDVRGFETGKQLLSALEEMMPELLLLDVMLPGDDGHAILKKLRQDPRTRKLPVIMVTAKGEEMDKVQGLDGGADDYVVKPFGVMELLSRVKALLRRMEPDEKPVLLTAGNIMMDVNRHKVTADGRSIPLTHMEFQLLRYLLENQGIVRSREKLLNAVWSMDYLGDTRTVDVHIRMLRQKLGQSGGLIATVRGVGYRLEG